MLRTAPANMRNMSDSSLKLKTSNLYSLNKLTDIDVIEKGYLLGGKVLRYAKVVVGN